MLISIFFYVVLISTQVANSAKRSELMPESIQEVIN